MNYTQTLLLLAAALCSSVCWRFLPGERRRIFAAWVFIALSIGFQIADLYIKSRWFSEVANAFQGN